MVQPLNCGKYFKPQGAQLDPWLHLTLETLSWMVDTMAYVWCWQEEVVFRLFWYGIRFVSIFASSNYCTCHSLWNEAVSIWKCSILDTTISENAMTKDCPPTSFLMSTFAIHTCKYYDFASLVIRMVTFWFEAMQSYMYLLHTHFDLTIMH